MTQCSNCGTGLPEGAKFCSHCGTKVAITGFCPECGAELKPTAKFCQACGQSVSGVHATASIDDHVETIESAPAPALRSLKAVLLPLIGIPVLIGILFLLTYKQKNPAPMSQSQMSQSEAPNATASDGNAQGMDMAAMESVSKQINKYKSDLKANPKDTTALLALGGMYEIAGRLEEAADYFKRYLEVMPNNAAVRMSLAGVYYNNAQRPLALNELQQVLKYNPNYDYAMFNLGVIYLAEGKKDEAIKWWHKVMETNPNGELAQKAREEIQKAGRK